MATYMFRWYELRSKLWETGHSDYNHLWAEPFLNSTLRNASLNVVRLINSEFQVLNYTEFDEIPKPHTYLGDEATRRRLAASEAAGAARGAGAAAGAADTTTAADTSERLVRQLAERSGDVAALRKRVGELQARLGSMDVLDEAVYSDATGERLPVMA